MSSASSPKWWINSNPNRPPSLAEAVLLRETIQSEERLLNSSFGELRRAQDALDRAKAASDAALRVTELAQANLGRIVHIVDGLEASIRSSRGSLGAIRRLPTEILDNIFLFAVDFLDEPITIMDAHHPALMVMRVCKRWQSVMLNASRLWRRIHVRYTMHNQRDTLNRGSNLHDTISRWLMRSKSQLLSLSFEIDLGRDAAILYPVYVQSVVPRLCRLIVSAMDRCEFLSIKNSDFLLECISVPTPNLKHVHLEAGIPNIKHPLLPSAPSLTHITTRHLFRSFRSLPFSRLESLSITEEWSCTLSQVITILCSFPTLRTLSLSILDNVKALPVYDLPPQPAELPHLRHLTIWEGWKDILPHLGSIDNLETLIWRFGILDRGPPPSFPFRAVQRLKNLRRLEIGYPWPELEDMVEMEDEERLIEMLTRLTKLEHLVIENAGVTDETLHNIQNYPVDDDEDTTDATALWLCPKLKSIVFKECWEITGDAMLEFVRARRSARPTMEDGTASEATLTCATLNVSDRYGLKSPWQEWQLREMAALLGTGTS